MKNRIFFVFTLFTNSTWSKINFLNTIISYIGVERTFTPIFEPLIQMRQMMYRWIDNEISQLFHVLSFSNSTWILNTFENAEFRTYSTLSGRYCEMLKCVEGRHHVLFLISIASSFDSF